MTVLIDAWQAALAAEQQAAFGYALLGPRLPNAHQGLARRCQAAHADLRDQAADAISTAGTAPAAPLGDYPALYNAVKSPETLAASLEDDCAAAWRYCYGQAAVEPTGKVKDEPSPALTATVRRQSQQGLIASAVRATQWRLLTSSAHPVVAFPGSS